MSNKKKYKIDIENEDYYEWNEPEKKLQTKNRLIQIAELGMEEVGIASFGIPNVMSGLYIEKVWNYSDKDFEDYLNWVKSLIKR